MLYVTDSSALKLKGYFRKHYLRKRNFLVRNIFSPRKILIILELKFVAHATRNVYSATQEKCLSTKKE